MRKYFRKPRDDRLFEQFLNAFLNHFTGKDAIDNVLIVAYTVALYSFHISLAMASILGSSLKTPLPSS